jgi:hypothetical protein
MVWFSCGIVKANFHSGKLSVDWNGQENVSLSCEFWVGTNDFNTCKETFSCPFQSRDNFPEWKLAFSVAWHGMAWLACVAGPQFYGQNPARCKSGPP